MVSGLSVLFLVTGGILEELRIGSYAQSEFFTTMTIMILFGFARGFFYLIFLLPVFLIILKKHFRQTIISLPLILLISGILILAISFSFDSAEGSIMEDVLIYILTLVFGFYGFTAFVSGILGLTAFLKYKKHKKNSLH
ncbi:hypothetical protein [Salinimicrobium flavum]|uniref:Uncharacterized protein n=1 Tax=Salinimicrobium flavum TaxID=1737065 RepID=A0ABW5IXA7_9FLAO